MKLFKLFNRIKIIGKYFYITIDDYKKDLDEVNKELSLLDETLNYYNLRRKVLLDWKYLLEVRIDKFDEKDNCKHCEYYTRPRYCSKFDSSVEDEATCEYFVWKKLD